ncbi:PREDICTED: F-box/FBD/LRR-repeat protein At1g13570-like [Ipomoea nil]|uniref:F-box/FBD/LRR-repeat protein At1g13570-like n=1 Tax=Ipomoea nil TaxID=35883 RepID=UPI000901D2DC|nr:PREDICTED: F-box/FBD/LRR-repeat protein At1g13570-like [Ipomoea nil]
MVYSIPKLEKLAFRACDGIENLDISAPKLTSFSQFCPSSIPRWFTAHLDGIKYLCLSADLSETAKRAPTFPTARNVQVMKLYRFRFGCERHLKLAIQLLEKSPNLCTLEIAAEKQEEWIDDKEGPSRIFKGPDIINKNLEMLNTVKIEWFKGSRHEMLFLKALLSKSVALDKVVVQELRNSHNALALINSRKLLDFPRASLKAQIVFMEYNFNYRLIDPPEF